MRKLSWVIDIERQGARGIGKMLSVVALDTVFPRPPAYIGATLTQKAQNWGRKFEDSV
ncbi:hypothetical protein CLV88_101379 [Shimia abyssi]|uniref:Uncharacterized protein n=1 Tax=Shimia abyssi TaxID=1662395 RepID=A0A2P8FJR5_9RHOB|nr:hypothetical protein CLV88_101379 [Shimia abyssi]